MGLWEAAPDRTTRLSDQLTGTGAQGHHIPVHLPPKITPALHGLPIASPVFTGRDSDLGTVLEHLNPYPGTDNADALRSSVVLVTAVGGVAGVGKTELAVQAARAAR